MSKLPPPLDRLALGWGRTRNVVLQTEAAECGLACLAMVASHHGHHTDLATLRARFPISQKGMTLTSLITVAQRMGLGTRPVKLSLKDLSQLRMPAILHWDFNHFVVLQSVRGHQVTVLDPAQGERELSLRAVSRSFTGVALELWPTPEKFEPKASSPGVRLRSLLGKIDGLGNSLLQVLLLSGVLELFALVNPFFMQWVIDHVIAGQDRDLLTVLVIGFGLLMLLQQAFSTARAWVTMVLGTTVNVQWRANIFEHLLHLPMPYFERRNLGDIISRFSSVETIQRTLTTAFLSAVLDGLMTLVTLVMMCLYSPRLAAVVLTAMAIYALGRWMWFRPLRHATQAEIVHAAKLESHFLESVRGVKAIKLFQRQDLRRASWLSILVDQVNASLRTQKLQLLYQQANGLLFGLENLVVVWLGARMVIGGETFTVGALMAFMAYKNQFESRISALIDKFFELSMLGLHGERLADIVHTPPEVTVARGNLPVPVVQRPVCLELRGVHFRYAEHEPEVLHDINLVVEPGESVALAGPSGCGKTTLANILLGILTPTQGQLLIDGRSVDDIGLDLLRRQVGTVLQDDTLFAGSIADNITFFDAQQDTVWMQSCAAMAAIHDEILMMPMKYNTLIGEMGSVLSGGQRQRILLARALYKRPTILLLDEATSHLDMARERQVNAAIQALNLTRIIIAHRPETIASADRVFMLGR